MKRYRLGWNTNHLHTLIGSRIRLERQDAKLQQRELAQRIGVSYSYMSQIEGGHRKTSLENLLKIANTLQLDINVFLKTISTGYSSSVKKNSTNRLTPLGFYEREIE